MIKLITPLFFLFVYPVWSQVIPTYQKGFGADLWQGRFASPSPMGDSCLSTPEEIGLNTLPQALIPLTGPQNHIIDKAYFENVTSELSGTVIVPITQGYGSIHSSLTENVGLPNAKIIVQYGSRVANTTTDLSGQWSTLINGDSAEITAKRQSESITLRNVVTTSTSNISDEELSCLQTYTGFYMIFLCFDLRDIVFNWSTDASFDYYTPSDDIEDIALNNIQFYGEQLNQWFEEGQSDWSPLEINVWANFSNMACNAFFIPTINNAIFGSASSDCPNTAYSSIIAHEIAHSIIQSYFNPSNWYQLDDIGAFHEGMADALAGIFLDTPCMGRDFHGDNTGCARNLEDTFQFPVDSGSTHVRGRPLSSAFWNLYQRLGLKYQSLDYARNKMRTLIGKFLSIAPQGLNSTILQRVMLADQMMPGDDSREIMDSFHAHGF